MRNRRGLNATRICDQLRHEIIRGVLGPGSRLVDTRKRLESWGQPAAKIDCRAANPQHRRARRSAIVEDKDLGAGKATPLKREE